MNSTLDYYNNNAEQYASSTQSLDFSEIQDQFLNLLPEGGCILDLGCGSGRDTKYFLEHGFKVDAFDGSEKMAALASEFTGIPVKVMDFNELSEIDKYDGVWACASLLHVPIEELSVIFTKIIIALKPQGIIYVSFKKGSFSGERAGRYYTDLTMDDLQKLITTVGQLDIIKSWFSEDVRPGREKELWINALLSKE